MEEEDNNNNNNNDDDDDDEEEDEDEDEDDEEYHPDGPINRKRSRNRTRDSTPESPMGKATMRTSRSRNSASVVTCSPSVLAVAASAAAADSSPSGRRRSSRKLLRIRFQSQDTASAVSEFKTELQDMSDLDNQKQRQFQQQIKRKDHGTASDDDGGEVADNDSEQEDQQQLQNDDDDDGDDAVGDDLIIGMTNLKQPARLTGSAREGQSSSLSINEFTKNPNGTGMWEAWTRSFNTPLLALMDLFDNAIDAGLDWNVHRQRQLIQAHPDPFEERGLVLINSSVHPVLPLRQVLQVYNSDKRSMSSIGQNGVGIKQACANLSNLSFILTKYHGGQRVEMGFLLDQLQHDQGVVFPDHTFAHVSKEGRNTYMDQLETLANEHPNIYGRAFAAYGDGDARLGADHLCRHIEEIVFGKHWKQYDHVFCVILCKLRHGVLLGQSQENEVNEQADEEDNYKGRTKYMLDTLANELPQKYIHVADSIQIVIQHRSVPFYYWERRLIELTKFEIVVDRKNDYSTSKNWKNPRDEDATTLEVYLGFDPFRVTDGKKQSPASLYVYSRPSGRLIKYWKDARGELGLSAGSTDFCQGLTILLFDYQGSLPLNPTKQDLSFGMEEHGQVHHKNLMEWIAAVTHLYYTFHLDHFGGKKSEISEAVKGGLQECKGLALKASLPDNRPFGGIGGNGFTKFTNVSWIRKFDRIRCQKTERKALHKIDGKDTLLRLKAPDRTNINKESTAKAPKTRRVATKKGPNSRVTHYSIPKKHDFVDDFFLHKSTATESLVSPSIISAKVPPHLAFEDERKLRRRNKELEEQEKKWIMKCEQLQERVKQTEESLATIYERQRKSHQTNGCEMQSVVEERARAQGQLREAKDKIDRLEQLLASRDETIRELEEKVEQLERQKSQHNPQDDKQQSQRHGQGSPSVLENGDEKQSSTPNGEIRRLREQLQSLRGMLQLHKDEAKMHSDLAEQRQEQIDVLKQLMKQSDDEKKLLRTQITLTTKRLSERFTDV